MTALDAVRTLIDEAANYAGPTDEDSAALWRAIPRAERAVRTLAKPNPVERDLARVLRYHVKHETSAADLAADVYTMAARHGITVP